MTYSTMTYAEQRRLAVLGYTENPQQDGTCCPYVSLPRDYFGKAHYAQRVERVGYWMPRLMAVLGESTNERAPKQTAFIAPDLAAAAWRVQA